jgi:hypothetical protein
MVTVGQLPRLPARTRRALADPLITALSAATSRARVTVVGLPDNVVVAVLADLPADDAARAAADGSAAPTEADVTVTYQREGPLLWLETRWLGGSGSRSSTTTRS